MASIRFAIASDLHYRVHDKNQRARPETAVSGDAHDPMKGLLRLVEKESNLSKSTFLADYLLCPGDISDKASPDGFEEGWKDLLLLKDALKAKHLVATTGNHEVDSRANNEDDGFGNSERTIDPLATTQRCKDYPCTFMKEEERWIYWGRGYQLIEQSNVLFLIINSSHFHHTTRKNEFERGRVSDVAIDLLRTELKEKVEKNLNRVFVALMHHHPIQHQPLDTPVEDRIDMVNGSQLMEILEETSVSWLVVHGHKHHGRLIKAQGAQNPPVVFAAGSFGAALTGVFATQTRLQFYIIDVEICDQSALPIASGHVRAWSWTGLDWEPSTCLQHGLPDRCGYSIPSVDLRAVTNSLGEHVKTSAESYMRWEEVIERQPDFGKLMPNDIKYLRQLFQSKNIKTTWETSEWFPTEVAK